MTNKLVAAFAAAVALATTTPASAQKSADTLRIAVTTPLQTIDGYYYASREWDAFYNSVYEPIVFWNDYKMQFTPSIAKAWKRIDDVTLEFEVRDDVKFHNGAKLTADDVAETFNFIADPKFNFFNKAKYSWIKTVEKTGPNTVRLVAKQPAAMDLMTLSGAHIYHAASLTKLEDRSQYGRVSPIGTGQYKLTQVDKNTGAIAVFNPDWKGPKSAGKAPAKIHGLPIPDRDVQVAHLLTNSVDAIRDPSVDELNNLITKPGVTSTAAPSYSYLIVQLDALNRSGQKELLDPRVRKAIFMGIDRQGIRDNLVAGKEMAVLPDTICQKIYRACDYSTKPVPYDPVAAKKLLAEAGFPNGFDLKIVSLDVSKNLATAVAGDLHKIGIRASVQPANVVVFRKMRTDGDLAMYVGERPVPIPDTGSLMDIFFAAESMDYWRDPVLLSALTEGATEHDNAKRTGIYKKAVDLINDKSYMLPIVTLPTVFVHSKDLAINKNPSLTAQTDLGDFVWK